MKNRKSKKFTFILVVIMALLCVIPVQTSLTVFADGGKAKGSTIGGVNISGLKEDEIKERLENAINDWKSKSIVIQGGGTELKIDPQEIQFDINSTIDTYKSLTHRPFFLFWMPDKVVHIPINISESEVVKNRISNISIWNTEETYAQVLNQASNLGSHKVEATVADTALLENERIALSIEKIPETTQGVQDLAEALNDTILQPNEPFSLLEKVEDIADLANAEGLNFFSSMLYNTILQARIDIIERNPQSSVPNYLQPGMDAYVNRFENKDLVFTNVSENPYLLKFTVEGDTLKVELYSNVKEENVKVHVNKETIAPRIINRYTEHLAIGKTQLIQEGKQGFRITVTRLISMNGDVVEQEISRDYYPPTNRIVLNSARTPKNETGSGSITKSGNKSAASKIENLDLNGDGLPDYDDGKETKNNSTNKNNGNNKSSSDSGSYYDKSGNHYDKAGNLITP